MTVAVLEAETVGYGASSRNGGMVLTGLKIPPEELVRRFGREVAREMFDTSVGAIDLVESLITTEGIDCAFKRCGHLEVASKRIHVDSLKRTAGVLSQAFDYRVRVLDRTMLADELQSDAFFGGLLDERSAGLDPARYVDGIARAVRRLGGAICERAPVERATRSRDSWRLQTPRGDVAAKRLIVATGAYTGTPFARLKRRFIPLGSYVIATEPLSQEVANALVPRGRMLFDSRRLLHYFRLTPDRRMLFGGRAAFVPERRDAVRASAEILQRDMVTVFPVLKDVGIDYCWGGTLDVTFDFMPHAGELDAASYAIGYAGHGVALATLLGTLVGSAVAGVTRENPFSSALPSAPLGLYDGRPWFLPLAGAWQRFLDWVN